VLTYLLCTLRSSESSFVQASWS